MANKNDEKILQLKKQIKAKKEKIGKIGRFNPVTNCSLGLDGVRYNLNVLSEEDLMQLLIKLNSLFLSAKDLGYVDTQFSGYALEEWIGDINAKLDILNKKHEEKALSLMEAKLEKMLSDEKQVELELESIAELLKS